MKSKRKSKKKTRKPSYVAASSVSDGWLRAGCRAGFGQAASGRGPGRRGARAAVPIAGPGRTSAGGRREGEECEAPAACGSRPAGRAGPRRRRRRSRAARGARARSLRRETLAAGGRRSAGRQGEAEAAGPGSGWSWAAEGARPTGGEAASRNGSWSWRGVGVSG